MIVFKKSIPRRTFLRGVGTTLALPLLDAMVPALKADRFTAAAPVRHHLPEPSRLVSHRILLLAYADATVTEGGHQGLLLRLDRLREQGGDVGDA